MPRNARSTLAIAFVLSALLHVLLLPLVRAPATPEPQETLGPISFESPQPLPSLKPPPTPTPRPTPTPVPTSRPSTAPRHTHRQAPQRHHTIALPHRAAKPNGTVPAAPPQSGPTGRDARPGTGQSGTDTGGGSAQSPEPVATPTPQATATPPPACTKPDVPAITLDPVVPDTPPLAQAQGIAGDVTVIVSLDAASHVTGVRIASSPSALLDDAALQAARASRFRTEFRDCRPVAADYAFIVEFSTQ